MRVILKSMIILAFILASGCLQDRNDNEQELTVSAAISLSDAFKDIGASFQKDHPGTRINFNFGASGTLMRQIEQGASVDVFASASQKEMDFLETKGLILEGTRTDFTKNELVIIAPSAIRIEELESPGVKRIAMGNPKTVPAGYYTRASLENAGLYEVLQPKLIFTENVRQVVSYVELGEVYAGFVYRSDTLKSNMAVSEINKSLYPDIVYPVAVIQDSQNKEIAGQFIEYILSKEGQTILDRYGFE